MIDPKSFVLRSIIGYALERVSKQSMVVATLGGNGHEAEMWNTMGLSPKQGWLIERSRSKQSNLVSNYRYQVCNQLDTFSKVISGATSSGVDCFHLDLCGTFSGKYQQVLPSIINLVSKSKGRIFAITVADQRGNAITQDWEHFGHTIKNDLGPEYNDLISSITIMHKKIPVQDQGDIIKPFDLEKSVQREIGLCWSLSHRFMEYAEITPILLHRYVYVSRLSGHPFRMRTYVFYIGDEPMSRSLFMRQWMSSPMTYINKGIATIISISERRDVIRIPVSERRDTQHMEKTGLHALVYASGNQTIIDEFLKLCKDQKKLQTIISTLGESFPTQDREPEPQVQSDVFHTKEVDTPPTESVNKKVQKKENKVKVYDDLSEKEKVEFLLYLTRERAKKGYTKKTWELEWQHLIKEKFGYYNPKLGRSIRSAFARVSGKFRAEFAAKVNKVLSPTEIKNVNP